MNYFRKTLYFETSLNLNTCENIRKQNIFIFSSNHSLFATPLVNILKSVFKQGKALGYLRDLFHPFFLRRPLCTSCFIEVAKKARFSIQINKIILLLEAT